MTENNLINRILSDAESSAAAIVEKARQSADESVRQAQEKALQTQQKLFVELEQERRRTLERRATVAEIDAKKKFLPRASGALTWLFPVRKKNFAISTPQPTSRL